MNQRPYNNKQNASFWYFLRRFKKKLRDKYVMDVQKAYERGFKEGQESDEVRRLAKKQWQDGHAQGVYNGLVRIVTPSIKSAPSPYIPGFVIKMLEEIRDEIEKLRKNASELRGLLNVALREGSFKVKMPPTQIVALKEIIRTNEDKKRKRDQDVEIELAEIEKIRYKKKRKKPLLVKPQSNQT
eukprot:TRINITY_DN1030_c0_g2_i1.p1 TRINITY_DN1030_c0_g2~~TRINITY_DN1030_c0_g2_i1.p1  ORF type:complete len:184 (-),score=34.63 TRINITY_DN1030_c0_g2_i1:183-734(-)